MKLKLLHMYTFMFYDKDQYHFNFKKMVLVYTPEPDSPYFSTMPKSLDSKREVKLKKL